jgi:hypothetical protein
MPATASRIALCLTLTAGALLAGCAAMSWQKPGVDSMTADNDLASCRGQAAVKSYPLVASSNMYLPAPWANNNLPYPTWPGYTSDKLMAETDFTTECMRRLGYRLERKQG